MIAKLAALTLPGMAFKKALNADLVAQLRGEKHPPSWLASVSEIVLALQDRPEMMAIVNQLVQAYLEERGVEPSKITEYLPIVGSVLGVSAETPEHLVIEVSKNVKAAAAMFASDFTRCPECSFIFIPKRIDINA